MKRLSAWVPQSILAKIDLFYTDIHTCPQISMPFFFTHFLCSYFFFVNVHFDLSPFWMTLRDWPLHLPRTFKLTDLIHIYYDNLTFALLKIT